MVIVVHCPEWTDWSDVRIRLHVDPSDTINTIKAKIRDAQTAADHWRSSDPLENQTLTCNGYVLSPGDCRLSECNVQHNATLNLYSAHAILRYHVGRFGKDTKRVWLDTRWYD